MPKKTKTDATVAEHTCDTMSPDEIQMWDAHGEIHDLVKLRSALSLGTKSGTRDEAESALNRAINKRVSKLSEMCIRKFGGKNR